MFVTTRCGAREAVSFEKVQAKLARLSHGLSCDPVVVAQRTIASIQNGATTSEIDAMSASIAAEMTTTNYDFYRLAGRILVDDLHKNTCDTFSGYVRASSGLFKEGFVEYVRAHADEHREAKPAGAAVGDDRGLAERGDVGTKAHIPRAAPPTHPAVL